MVLNGTQGCWYCADPEPIHTESLVQRKAVPVNPLAEAIMDAVHVQGPTETIEYNTWAGKGIPQTLIGRIDPSAWTNFINAVSQLEMSQPGCCAQVFLCKCCSSDEEFEKALKELEDAYARSLGAVSFSKRQYHYQVWVPRKPPTHNSEGREISREVPAHWETRTLEYMRIDLATPPHSTMAPAVMTQPPGMQPVMMQPVMMQQPGMQMQPGVPGPVQPLQPIPMLQPLPPVVEPVESPKPHKQAAPMQKAAAKQPHAPKARTSTPRSSSHGAQAQPGAVQMNPLVGQDN